VRGRDRVALLVAFVSFAVALVACGSGPPRAVGRVHVQPEANFTLPPASEGCGGATNLPGGGSQLPLTVSTVAGQVAEAVNVCVNGQGPFPFVLDTGAGESTIDADLAKRLHLPTAGRASEFAGVGCTGTAQPVSVDTWTVEGLDLAPQQLTAATLPEMGGKGQPDGLLGSDVLSRFGAVRIDFAAGALVVPGPEGAALSGSTPVAGPVGPPPAPVLTGNGQGSTIPVVVTPDPGDVSLNVAVRFGLGPKRTFAVDTGSSQSVVATSVARGQSLTRTDLAQRQATVCSTITVPLVHSGPWSLPAFPLTPQLLGETGFGVVGAGGIDGLLGSDQLRRYGWVVLDYSGARMVLG
jgi:predicted aspartyl protease